MKSAHAKRSLGFACAFASLLVASIGFFIAATDPPAAPGKNRGPENLLCFGSAALLAALSAKLLKTDHDIRPIRGYRPQPPKPEFVAVVFEAGINGLRAADEGAHGTLWEEFVIDVQNVTGGYHETYTVAQLESFAIAHLNGKSAKLPLLRPAFFRVRQALCDTLRVQPQNIRPSTELRALFPVNNRRELWSDFFKRLNSPAIPLELPYGFKWVVVVAWLPYLCLSSVIVDWLGHHSNGAITLLVFLSSLITFAALLRAPVWAARRMGMDVQFPQPLQTVGELVRNRTRHDLQTSIQWNEGLIRLHVREILKAVSAVPPFQINPEARLITDLGIPLFLPQVPQSTK